ncbi:MAG TPA: 4-(cytidine 5'-diphospho)-2-C-methyl-D-erythritol kinase [Candidatus Methylomirabilis sp.]|nr:4-(cytidine 5'-diphospho)-2-C-methyl-D-erythritol kinase [Candidatus Methylomirabilis sp.]
MDDLQIRSPAKINLFLEVVDRRPDGYHEIETVMQLVDLCDEVHLHRMRRGIQVSVAGADLPIGRENLAYQAAALLQERTGLREGVHIHLEKHIPVAGGLGGGSSNAAAVLAGLTRLYGLGETRETLQKLAAQLGSDIPFFLTDGLALATGRGERLATLRPWPPFWVVLANPGVAISTAWAYREASSKLTAWQGRASIQALIANDRIAWPPVWAFNRLEAVVLPQHPEVSALKSLLQEGGGSPVLMSGSGASVFAVVPDGRSAEALATRIRAGGQFAAAVTTLPANPIQAALA